MIDKDAILQLEISGATAAANAALDQVPNRSTALVALHDQFKTHDLERYLPQRRRARGAMVTTAVEAFAHYVAAHREPGASVFVDGAKMVARAVLNLGTPTAPGHADNSANYHAETTAAYDALRIVTNGHPLSQTQAAEFLEDWADLLECWAEAEALSPGKAAAAVRAITIDAQRKDQSEVQQLSESRSAFEHISASSKHLLPTHIYYTCEPYLGFAPRRFVLRLSVAAGDKAPRLTLRIIKREQHAEEMAAELASLVGQAMVDVMADGDEMPDLYLGSYEAKA